MAANRIYLVGENGSPLALVSAISRAEAIKHATTGRFSATVVGQMELAQLVEDGMRVQMAREPELDEVVGDRLPPLEGKYDDGRA